MKRVFAILLAVVLSFSSVLTTEAAAAAADVNLFTVEITVPADYIEGETQESLDALVKENGWKSATLNADGSATYVMSKAKHKELMSGMKQSLEESLNAMMGSENFPNFVSAKANDDFTAIEITTKAESLNFTESFSVLAFYWAGGMYNSFNGTPANNINVKYINEATGAVIEEYNSNAAAINTSTEDSVAEENAIVEEIIADDEKATDLSLPKSDAPSVQVSKAESKTEDDSPTVTVANKEEPVAETIEEIVLLDDKGVKITAKELVLDSSRADIKVLIENNSDTDLTIQIRNASVNGYMVDPTMSADVAAGKKAIDDITFYKSDLAKQGIDTIADVELSFHIITAEGWDSYLDSDQIQIKTSAADSYEYKFDDSGAIAYEGNGIKIVAKGLNDANIWYYPGLTLYLENTGDQALTVQARDVSVNGFMIDPIFSSDIMPGKRVLASVKFMETDLSDNYITEITEIELSFHVVTAEGWDDVVDTEKLVFTF